MLSQKLLSLLFQRKKKEKEKETLEHNPHFQTHSIFHLHSPLPAICHPPYLCSVFHHGALKALLTRRASAFSVEWRRFSSFPVPETDLSAAALPSLTKRHRTKLLEFRGYQETVELRQSGSCPGKRKDRKEEKAANRTLETQQTLRDSERDWTGLLLI